MEQEDHLKKQIDQLGRVLGKILANLLGLSTQGQIMDGIETVHQSLRGELDLDMNEIMDDATDEWIRTLITKKGLTHEHLQSLADIWLWMADHDPQQSDKFYAKCLAIYQYLETAERTYSLDRQWKITHIKNQSPELN